MEFSVANVGHCLAFIPKGPQLRQPIRLLRNSTIFRCAKN
jgi:hypothetical protein